MVRGGGCPGPPEGSQIPIFALKKWDFGTQYIVISSYMPSVGKRGEIGGTLDAVCIWGGACSLLGNTFSFIKEVPSNDFSGGCLSELLWRSACNKLKNNYTLLLALAKRPLFPEQMPTSQRKRCVSWSS